MARPEWLVTNVPRIGRWLGFREAEEPGPLSGTDTFPGPVGVGPVGEGPAGEGPGKGDPARMPGPPLSPLLPEKSGRRGKRRKSRKPGTPEEPAPIVDGRQVTPPGRRPASPDAVRADAVYLATLRSLAALDSDLARDAAADLGSAYRRRYGPLPYPAPSSAPAPDPAPAPDGPPPPSGIGPPTPPPEGGDTVERA